MRFSEARLLLPCAFAGKAAAGRTNAEYERCYYDLEPRAIYVFRIVHAEPEAVLLNRELSVEGFNGHAEQVECGICLDALEEVGINGCTHKLCGALLFAQQFCSVDFCSAEL